MTTLLETAKTNKKNPATPAPAPTPIPPHPDTPTLPQISLPPGQLTLLIGDPGTGKSLLALDLAARISQGRPLPPTNLTNCTNLTSSPILIYSAEDTRDTILNRLRASGAALHQFNIITSNMELVPPLPELADLIPGPRDSKADHLLRFVDIVVNQSGNIALLIIDPLPALLGSHDSYRAASLRAHLLPILDYAQGQNFPVLGITHLAKPTGKNKHPLHRIIGSLAYSALARAIYHITPDPRDPNTRLVIPLKQNLEAITHAYSFKITPTSRLEWNQTPIPHTPLDALAEESEAISQSQLEFACDFLTTTLDNGPIPSVDLLRQSRQLAISRSTLTRAKYLLCITSKYDLARKLWLTARPAP